MNFVEVSVEGVESPEWLDRLQHFCLEALRRMGKTGWEVSLLLCDDKFIHDLNSRFRGIDAPTDVLSFPQSPGQDPIPLEEEETTPFVAGDIVISLDSLAQNAVDFGVDKAEELKRLVLHGLLHLAGMDHPSNEPEEEMLIYQERVLQDLAQERIL
ncbi:MAG TPA: rRNA maturation RNase YbeY [Spirochaetia bacterium]|nr:rRNA maturation RNase YbeY [Spirochaetia bacterium]